MLRTKGSKNRPKTTEFMGSDPIKIPYFPARVLGRILTRDLQIMDEIIDECAKFSASRLVDITHAQTPWKKAYRSFSKVITPESIKRYFEEEQ